LRTRVSLPLLCLSAEAFQTTIGNDPNAGWSRKVVI
jgi:hypothetical protein